MDNKMNMIINGHRKSKIHMVIASSNVFSMMLKSPQNTRNTAVTDHLQTMKRDSHYLCNKFMSKFISVSYVATHILLNINNKVQKCEIAAEQFKKIMSARRDLVSTFNAL